MDELDELMQLVAGAIAIALVAWYAVRAESKRLAGQEARPVLVGTGSSLGVATAAPLYSPDRLMAAQREMADLIIEEARAANVPPAFMLALAVTESSLRPTAIGDDGLSIGLFQMQARTAGQFRPGVSREDLLDPTINARVAMDFARWLHDTWPQRSFGAYAEAWTLGGAGKFNQGKSNPAKLTQLAQAIADLNLDLDARAIWV